MMSRDRMTVEYIIRRTIVSYFSNEGLILSPHVYDHLASFIYLSLVNSGYDIIRPMSANKEKTEQC